MILVSNKAKSDSDIPLNRHARQPIKTIFHSGRFIDNSRRNVDFIFASLSSFELLTSLSNDLFVGVHSVLFVSLRVNSSTLSVRFIC